MRVHEARRLQVTASQEPKGCSARGRNVVPVRAWPLCSGRVVRQLEMEMEWKRMETMGNGDRGWREEGWGAMVATAGGSKVSKVG